MGEDGTTNGGALTRRTVLGGAGVAIATGVAVTASSASGASASASAVATGPTGTTVVEFRGRISQSGPNGEQFASYGYLTSMNGASARDMFGAGTPSDATALFTVAATGDLVSRVLDTRVHLLDIVGELAVYQRDSPGASFADPSSFSVGHQVARFALQLQDVLAVFAPASGLPTLTGDMRQKLAGGLFNGLRGSTFGDKGDRFRMFATGIGTLVDPVTLNAELEIAGNWSAA